MPDPRAVKVPVDLENEPEGKGGGLIDQIVSKYRVFESIDELFDGKIRFFS